MTWDDIVNQSIKILEEASGNNHWGDSILKGFAYDGEADLISQAECNRVYTQQNITAGSTPASALITLPTGIIRILQVIFYGNDLPLIPADEKYLESAYQSRWETLTGTPKYYIPYSTSQIRLVPIPDTTITNGISFTYLKAPAAFLGTVGTSPEISSTLHRYLTYYVVYRALEGDQANRSHSPAFYNLFQSGVEKAREMVNPKDRIDTIQPGILRDFFNYNEAY